MLAEGFVQADLKWLLYILRDAKVRISLFLQKYKYSCVLGG